MFTCFVSLHSNKLKEAKRTQDEGLGQTTFACIERRTHTNMLMLLFRSSFKILLIFAYLFHFPPFFLCVLNVSQFPPFGHIVLSIHSTCSYHKKRHFESFVPKNPKRKIKEVRGRGHGLCPFTSCILI